VLASLAATPLAAQVASTTHGFSLGLHLQGATLDPEDDLGDRGGGAGLDLGWGFRNGLGLFLTIAGAAMEPDEDKIGASYTLVEADLGVRYAFLGETARGRPFVEAAVSSMMATFEDVEWFGDETDVEISGPAFSVGGGIEYFFSPAWSGLVGLRWSAGSFDEVKIGNLTVELDPGDEFDVRTTRFQLGVRHHFAGG
jgi:hypothetical protein